ncbi:MAG: hypothetical protein N4A40_12750 [Tissierellales bacterium]|jgi:hypothetical protein|nr:hypothetical protein [Tissierellales bacterium]
MKRTIFLLAGLTIFIPIALDVKLYTFSNVIKDTISNADLIGFWGSYTGGILGGLCTLVGVGYTINHNKEEKKEEKKIELKKENYSNVMKSIANVIVIIDELKIVIEDLRNNHMRTIRAFSKDLELYSKEGIAKERYVTSSGVLIQDSLRLLSMNSSLKKELVLLQLFGKAFTQYCEKDEIDSWSLLTQSMDGCYKQISKIKDSYNIEEVSDEEMIGNFNKFDELYKLVSMKTDDFIESINLRL